MALIRKFIAGVLLVLAGALVGCQKSDAGKPFDPLPVGAAPAAPDPLVPSPLKVAFAYVGAPDDAGWTLAHEQARKAVQAEFGDKIVTTTVDNVPESVDAERVLRDLVGRGNKLIFGTAFGFMEPLLKVAADTPDVKFEHATGYQLASNLGTYDVRTYEGAYLAGVIAGGMTKSNVLGVVGAIPVPEVIRNINAFTLGARSVNPRTRTKVAWVNKWFDPVKEAEVADGLIVAGADVLLQTTDSLAVLKKAEEKGVYAFGWETDMSAFAPNAHLASAVIHWAPLYRKTIKDTLDGAWQSQAVWWGIREGAIDFVSLSDKVPTELKNKVAAVKAGLADGSFAIWRGPIVGPGGFEILVRKDEVADDAFLSGMGTYVRGVEGSVPAPK